VLKIVGICGYPLHGKTTAQGFLESSLGFKTLDDSLPIREMAMDRWKLTWDQVSTQEGKASTIQAFDTEMTVREAMGRLGKVMENLQGDNYWIDCALRKLHWPIDKRVSFGSVRMSQGRSIKNAGGMVIAIIDPRKPMSHHDFDQFDYDYVDVMIMNDGTIGEFRDTLIQSVEPFFGYTR
jgi:hypothetical protein